MNFAKPKWKEKMKQLLSVKVLSLSKVVLTFFDSLNAKLISATVPYGRPLSDHNTTKLHAFSNGTDLLSYSAKTHSIPGMTAPSELKALYYAVLFAPRGNVVEIGSWLGKSTVFIAKALQQKDSGQVYAVDTFQGNAGKESLYTAPLSEDESIYQRFKNNLNVAGVQKVVKPLKTTSEKASYKKELKSAAVVFIDGCHEYDEVLEDIKRWKSHVKKDGLLILHDYHPNFPGVVAAAKEQLAKSSFTPLFLCDTLLAFRKN